LAALKANARFPFVFLRSVTDTRFPFVFFQSPLLWRIGESGGYGGGHKHHHKRSCHKKFNDAFQTPSPPFYLVTTMPIEKGAVKGFVRNSCYI
jgi:hypothetical protein